MVGCRVGHNASPGKGLCETNKKSRVIVRYRGIAWGPPEKEGVMLEEIKERLDRYGEIKWQYGKWLVNRVEELEAENERLQEREEIHWPYELDMARREIKRLGGTVESDGVALQA